MCQDLNLKLWFLYLLVIILHHFGNVLCLCNRSASLSCNLLTFLVGKSIQFNINKPAFYRFTQVEGHHWGPISLMREKNDNFFLVVSTPYHHPHQTRVYSVVAMWPRDNRCSCCICETITPVSGLLAADVSSQIDLSLMLQLLHQIQFKGQEKAGQCTLR